MKQKAFFIIFKGISLKQIHFFFWREKVRFKTLFSFSKSLSFCYKFLVIQKKRIDQRDYVNFGKFMTSKKPGLQTIAIDILRNISQRKSKQVMKLGQLIEYNKRRNFFSKIVPKMKQGDLLQTCFFKKMLNMREEQEIWSLVSIYFDSTQLGIQ